MLTIILTATFVTLKIVVSISNEKCTVPLHYKLTFITFVPFLKMGNRHIKRKSVFNIILL